ncbi:hypothetical protein BC829DRAFT_287317 [Chytridium lagenaria]|nr:hypothetical protein BC829DRAFT_287317 [Chytridium lagenaria]
MLSHLPTFRRRTALHRGLRVALCGAALCVGWVGGWMEGGRGFVDGVWREMSGVKEEKRAEDEKVELDDGVVVEELGPESVEDVVVEKMERETVVEDVALEHDSGVVGDANDDDDVDDDESSINTSDASVRILDVTDSQYDSDIEDENEVMEQPEASQAANESKKPLVVFLYSWENVSEDQTDPREAYDAILGVGGDLVDVWIDVVDALPVDVEVQVAPIGFGEVVEVLRRSKVFLNYSGWFSDSVYC